MARVVAAAAAVVAVAAAATALLALTALPCAVCSVSKLPGKEEKDSEIMLQVRRGVWVDGRPSAGRGQVGRCAARH